MSDLNPKVVNGVAPLSGSSTSAASWLVDQWADLRVPSIKSCLADAGRTDLLSEALDHVKSGARSNLTGVGPSFRNLDSIAAHGFHDELKDPLDSMFDASADPTGKIILECTDQLHPKGTHAKTAKKSSEIRKLVLELSTAWQREIDSVAASDAFDGTYEAFAKCMQAKGVPAPDVRNFRAFAGYLDGLTQREGVRGPTLMKVAQKYAACRAPYDEALAAQLKKKRPEFLQDHLDQIGKLSRLVASA